ncbi:MAG: S1C family serine protease [Acidimicrobiales bacterium]
MDEEGRIVTNHHVAPGPPASQVALADGQRAAAEVVAPDPVADLAVSHQPAEHPTAGCSPMNEA